MTPTLRAAAAKAPKRAPSFINWFQFLHQRMLSEGQLVEERQRVRGHEPACQPLPQRHNLQTIGVNARSTRPRSPDQCRLAAAMPFSWRRRRVSCRPHTLNARAKRSTPRAQTPAPKEPEGARAVPASPAQIRAHTGQAGQLVQRKGRHPSQDFAQRPGDQTVQPQAWRRHQKWSPK